MARKLESRSQGRLAWHSFASLDDYVRASLSSSRPIVRSTCLVFHSRYSQVGTGHGLASARTIVRFALKARPDLRFLPFRRSVFKFSQGVINF